MNSYKYSILIPVYNAEKYIKECLDSCIKQANNQFEIICVDDGSVDASGSILEEYASLYDYIKVIHKENEGVSIARNIALKGATGEYIIFLDADDLLEDNVISQLDEVLKENSYDLLVGRKRHAFINERKQVIYNLQMLSNDMNIERVRKQIICSKDNFGIWAVWRHVFNREFLVNNDIWFNANYSYGEDMDFIIRSIRKMNSYMLFDFALVNYRIYDESVSGNYSLKSAISHIRVLSYWRSEFRKDKEIVSYFANKQLAMLPHLKHLSKADKDVYFEEFLSCSKYLNKASGKFKIVYILGKMMGYRKLSDSLGR